MSFIITEHIQCRIKLPQITQVMQMTYVFTKAVASLTPCLRQNKAPATTLSRRLQQRPCHVRFARQRAHSGVIFARRRESEWSTQGSNSHVIQRSVPDGESDKSSRPADAAARRFIASRSCPIGFRRAVDCTV